MDLDRTPVQGKLHHLADDGREGLGESYAANHSRLRRLCPSGFFGGQIEHGKTACVISWQVSPEFLWILAGMMRCIAHMPMSSFHSARLCCMNSSISRIHSRFSSALTAPPRWRWSASSPLK